MCLKLPSNRLFPKESLSGISVSIRLYLVPGYTVSPLDKFPFHPPVISPRSVLLIDACFKQLYSLYVSGLIATICFPCWQMFYKYYNVWYVLIVFA